MTLKVLLILSGYSSLILDIKRVHIPNPVTTLRDWNPCRQSLPVDSFLTTSSTKFQFCSCKIKVKEDLTFRVVTLYPIILGSGLPKTKLLAEELSHRAWLTLSSYGAKLLKGVYNLVLELQAKQFEFGHFILQNMFGGIKKMWMQILKSKMPLYPLK